MASTAIQLADEIAAYLNGQTIGQDTLVCERKLIPDRDLASVRNLRAIVVPHSFESRIAVRGLTKERTLRIDVGIMKRAPESELDGLLGLTQQIGDLLEGHRFTGGICIEVAYSPLYDVEIWLQQHSFFAVIVATVKVFT